MKISVITPASKGVKELESLLRDFKNQIFKDFEHIIVWDGTVPDDVNNFMNIHKKDYNIKFTSIEKDSGDIKTAPGTKPRNHGISLATGEYCCFCDDDDRYKDSYLEALIDQTWGNTISCVQMSCSESRMMRNGDPNIIRLVPEMWLPVFPVMCHIGTPCLIVRTLWAKDILWREEPEHDIRFMRRVLEKYQPTVLLKSGMQVDVDGLVIGKMRDWVSQPPFHRDGILNTTPQSTKRKYLTKEYPSNKVLL